MKLSNTGIGSTKLNNIDEMYPAQSILLQTGQLVQYGAGLFAYNTIPLLVRRKLENIIVETLNQYNCIEVLLPTLQPDTIWKNSGRYDHYVKEGTMLITNSNKGTFCLAPTGEEAMLEFAREKLKSYKNLPVTFYQIGEKYRNEIRTRGYLLRGKSFPMLDAYSFDENEAAMEKSYENIRKAFLEIFQKIGLEVKPIVADNGAMGGKKSEEFML
ncbi:MAG: proline--tRNA ligase, partial [Clostridia bacterium]|nr:proline--tRNA ligase [Clostridia bacterium]